MTLTASMMMMMMMMMVDDFSSVKWVFNNLQA
jgi:hypothetical protein